MKGWKDITVVTHTGLTSFGRCVSAGMLVPAALVCIDVPLMPALSLLLVLAFECLYVFLFWISVMSLCD